MVDLAPRRTNTSMREIESVGRAGRARSKQASSVISQATNHAQNQLNESGSIRTTINNQVSKAKETTVNYARQNIPRAIGNTTLLGSIPRIAGIATIGYAVYRSLINGSEKADMFTKNNTADNVLGLLENNATLTSRDHGLNKFKSGYTKWALDNQAKIVQPLNQAKNYAVGVGQELLSSVIPIGLGLVAIFNYKNTKQTMKNILNQDVQRHAPQFFAQAATALIGVGLIKTLVYDVMGIGKSKDIKG